METHNTPNSKLTSHNNEYKLPINCIAHNITLQTHRLSLNAMSLCKLSSRLDVVRRLRHCVMRPLPLLLELLRVRSVLPNDEECDQAGGISEIALADGAHEDY